MTTDKLLERIQKLMALADPTKNDSQAQVEAALEKVAELLAKHKLMPEQVTIHELKSQLTHKRVMIWNDVADGTLHATSFARWFTDLARDVGYANYCKVLYMPHGATFIGKQRDVEIAEFMFSNLAHRLIKLSKQAVKEYEKQYRQEHGDTAYKSYGRHHPKVWRKTWLQGAVNGLHDKLCKPRFDKELEELRHKEFMALIEINDNAVQAYLNDVFPHLRKGMKLTESKGSWDTFAAGLDAGRRLSLQQGMDAGSKNIIKELSDGR